MWQGTGALYQFQSLPVASLVPLLVLAAPPSGWSPVPPEGWATPWPWSWHLEEPEAQDPIGSSPSSQELHTQTSH